MIRGESLRELYRSKGPAGFVRTIKQSMGLLDERCRPYRDVAGNIIYKPTRNRHGNLIENLRPEEFNTRELADVIFGDSQEDKDRKLRPDNLQRALEIERQYPLVEQRVNFLEEGQGSISASAFADINAWTGVVSGLLEISLMDGWQMPGFIADELMPVENTRMFEGRKVIGTTRLGDVAEERLPGMPTKRAQVGERWITQPRTVENALAVEVQNEAAYLDLTGTLLEDAKAVGEWLRYRKEIRVINAFIGVYNTYQYKGVGYNTYLTSGYFINSITGNELLHEGNIENIEILFRNMTDPETNTLVTIVPDMILLNREKIRTANAIFGPTAVQYQYRDIPGSTSSPQSINVSDPAYKGKYRVLESPLVWQQCVSPQGLNLSSTAAGKMMWVWKKGKPFRYAQNWPLKTETAAAANSVEMLDRGIMLYMKAHERGIPMVREPRYIVQSSS
jgi:hypothetical protein